MPRIISVFGATGTQGSSVVAAILKEGTFQARAITRDPSSAASKALAALGVEVVEGDLWDRVSLEKAIAGSEGVFGVTNFWDLSIMRDKPSGEVEQGLNLIEASKSASVKFFVWSSVEDYEKRSNGKYPGVVHVQGKVDIGHYLKGSGLPYAIVETGWFAENIWKIPCLVPSPESGKYQFVVPCYSPTSAQAITWVSHDLGLCVLALFKNYNDPGNKDIVLGETFVAISEIIESYPQLCKTISTAIGKPVEFVSPPTSGIKELDEMFHYQSEIGMASNVEVPDPRFAKLGVKFGSMKELAETELKTRFL